MQLTEDQHLSIHAAGLIDEMIIFIVPVVLGRGVRLFPETANPLTLNYKAEEIQLRSNGFIQLNVKCEM